MYRLNAAVLALVVFHATPGVASDYHSLGGTVGIGLGVVLHEDKLVYGRESGKGTAAAPTLSFEVGALYGRGTIRLTTKDVFASSLALGVYGSATADLSVGRYSVGAQAAWNDFWAGVGYLYQDGSEETGPEHGIQVRLAWQFHKYLDVYGLWGHLLQPSGGAREAFDSDFGELGIRMNFWVPWATTTW